MTVARRDSYFGVESRGVFGHKADDEAGRSKVGRVERVVSVRRRGRRRRHRPGEIYRQFIFCEAVRVEGRGRRVEDEAGLRRGQDETAAGQKVEVVTSIVFGATDDGSFTAERQRHAAERGPARVLHAPRADGE